MSRKYIASKEGELFPFKPSEKLIIQRIYKIPPLCRFVGGGTATW